MANIFRTITNGLRRLIGKPTVKASRTKLVPRVPLKDIRIPNMPNRFERRRRLKSAGAFHSPRFMGPSLRSSLGRRENLTITAVGPLYGRRSER